MNLQEQIRRILKEELYSPQGTEFTPNKFVVHKSNPMFRVKIKKQGLTTQVGECYQIKAGDNVKCKPAIFATNSLDENDMYEEYSEAISKNIIDKFGSFLILHKRNS